MCDVCDAKELKRRVEVEIRRGKPLDRETYNAVMTWVRKPWPPLCAICGKADDAPDRPCLATPINATDAIKSYRSQGCRYLRENDRLKELFA